MQSLIVADEGDGGGSEEFDLLTGKLKMVKDTKSWSLALGDIDLETVEVKFRKVAVCDGGVSSFIWVLASAPFTE